MSCFETLKQKGFKLTPQRRLIIDIIHDAHKHISAEDIVDIVRKRMPGVNKSTIYRTLELLEKYNCVFKTTSLDKTIYHHAEEGHHHHLVCSKCGKTVFCEEDIFAPLERILEEKHGFQINFKHLIIKGVCEGCQDLTG
jgi:Fur family transcriptional regulator, ferric uptake regulator